MKNLLENRFMFDLLVRFVFDMLAGFISAVDGFPYLSFDLLRMKGQHGGFWF